MVPPVLFGRLGSFDAGVITRRHIADAVGDPFDMLFDGWQHIGQNRRAAGAGDGEQIGEIGHRQAEITARPIGPAVGQTGRADTADVDIAQGPGHRVEPGGDHQHVDLVQGAVDHHAGFGDPLDRRRLDVDQADIVTVIGFEIPRIQA